MPLMSSATVRCRVPAPVPRSLLDVSRYLWVERTILLILFRSRTLLIHALRNMQAEVSIPHLLTRGDDYC